MSNFWFSCLAQHNGVIPILRRWQEQKTFTKSIRQQEELDHDEDPATDVADDARKYFSFCRYFKMSLILYVRLEPPLLLRPQCGRRVG